MRKLVVTDNEGIEIYSRPLLQDDNKESRMWLLDSLSNDLGIPVTLLKIKVKKEVKPV